MRLTCKLGLLIWFVFLLPNPASAEDLLFDDPDAADGWLAAGAELARSDVEAEPPGEEQKPSFVPWERRVGPAYPDDPLHSFGRWAKELPETLWDDTAATFTDRTSLILFGASVAAGIAIQTSGADAKVASHYRHRGSDLSTFWDSVGDAGGSPATHFAVAGAMYFTSLARGDNENYEKSKTLINALALNGLVTLALKGIVNSEAPNGGDFGWPSGHTSSSFCFAAVMYDEYGPWVGIPCYAFAAFVGYERVDARNHDFSDVVSGALIGIAIGHAVSRNHQERLKLLGMDVVPWTDPTRGTIGIALAKSW
ncbi:MAG: phosphatase PAP2 family protein [Planctomycetota bacterium]|jgi:hypothetical protein